MSELKNKIDRITDILRRDDGISGAMHYTEQISWVLFLKFLNDYEDNKVDESLLDNTQYARVLKDGYRWNQWACPKDENGKLDIKKARTGDDLTEFVNKMLFPYLKDFKAGTTDPRLLKYKIGAIFEYLDNRIVSGHTLREVLDIVDGLDFQSSDEIYELSLIYEELLKGMGSDGGNSGEFYTPRAIINAAVRVTAPHVGDTVYDGAVGSAGFLVAAWEYMTAKGKKEKYSASEWETLKTQTFFGREKTSLGYVMGMMNLILHGIESPNVYKENTLTYNIRDIQEKDRHSVILANPPFGGKEKAQIQQNFPVASNATELLFLQHFMKMLRQEGRAAIVVPEGVLFQTNKAFTAVKQDLLRHFNVHTIVSLPAGVFLPYSGVKTNLLFFNRTGATNKVWYYEVEPPYKLTKNKPITEEHLQEFVDLYLHPEKRGQGNPQEWTVSLQEIEERDYDLSAKNPHKVVEVQHDSPQELLKKIKANDQQVQQLLQEIEGLINE